MMRSARSVRPFVLGAISMLAIVVAGVWAAPGVQDRMQLARGWGGPPPEIVAGDPARMAKAPLAPIVGVDPSGLPAAETAAGRSTAPGLLIPVQGVTAASLVDTYEQARGQGRRHDAMDIMAPRGTPVLAASDGVVMKLFESSRGGTTLYQLDPDRRTIYYYAHLDSYAGGMAEGRALRRGELLGYVGNTGDAGPGNYHLHFEVSTTRDPDQYWGGVPQNPYPLLR